MHRKQLRAAARTAALGGTLVLGLGSAQAAMAQPPTTVHASCYPGALASAISGASSGETIVLAPGCTYWLAVGLSDYVPDLTIVGEDSLLERAPDAPSLTLLKVNYGKTLTLDDVNFTNGGGSSENDGGAIYNHGTLTVNGGTFSDNRAGEYGAIDSFGLDVTPSLTVNDAYFTGNGGGYGGAIEIGRGSTATISDSTFSQNSTPGGYGGAIKNDGLAAITGSSFLGNTSKYGGAIYNDGALSTTDDTFTGNRGYEGGGIYNDGGFGGGPIIPGDNALTANLGYEGGGIVNDVNLPMKGGLTDNGSLIVFNSAYLGGGIYNGSCADYTLTGTTIFGNVTDNVYNTDDC
jgi:large repetitive protein